MFYIPSVWLSSMALQQFQPYPVTFGMLDLKEQRNNSTPSMSYGNQLHAGNIPPGAVCVIYNMESGSLDFSLVLHVINVLRDTWGPCGNCYADVLDNSGKMEGEKVHNPIVWYPCVCHYETVNNMKKKILLLYLIANPKNIKVGKMLGFMTQMHPCCHIHS